MTTEIKSASKMGVLTLSGDACDGVSVGYRRLSGGSSLFQRADFLAAVETELGVRLVAADAIVIDRAMIPKVLDDGPYPSARSVSGARSFILNPNDTHESLTCDIAALVALRNYRTAHPAVPPVSDEDVETLAGLLLAEGLRSVGFATVARRLLATGKVEVTP